MIASPIRPRIQRQESGIAARGRLAHPRNALRRFTFVRHHNASMASFRPALTEAPQRRTSRTGAARSIPGRALASSMLDSPYRAPVQDFTPPISTSVPRHTSGSRGSCPPRLPQNRTYAVRIRLLGTAGYDPRGRPVCDLEVIPITPVAAIRGRRSAGAPSDADRPPTRARAWRSKYCAGPGRPHWCDSAPTRTYGPGRPDATPPAGSHPSSTRRWAIVRLRFQWRRMIARNRRRM